VRKGLGALKPGGARPDKLHAAAGPPQQATLAEGPAGGGADPAPPPPPPPPLVPHRSQAASAFKAAAAGERMVRKLSFGSKSKRGKGDLQGDQGVQH
jgi:hypothetical protein